MSNNASEENNRKALESIRLSKERIHIAFESMCNSAVVITHAEPNYPRFTPPFREVCRQEFGITLPQTLQVKAAYAREDYWRNNKDLYQIEKEAWEKYLAQKTQY